ncbi:MAG: hypothetical protein COS99_07265 [Candidatus Omnitrophica bacterium CG07_land_8_20_14_0_80_42_15]|uniref:HAD family phosphatase n=1 Tax=Candidatus Aquitaenariimonas noxiae TaxID=1974741 RepID=A0A2J0KTM1_9BACT|nr:MAG: hypothetical protein COS99_07265 [Candidatus Omnitrophica bacterium CG07_land_8_20_14_0_80_42_15]
MAIKVIIFDLGNVVLKFDMRIIARKMAKRFSLNEDEVFQFFFDSPLTHIHDEGRISSKEFYHRAMEKLGIKMDFTEFKKIWLDIFTENNDVTKLILSLSKHYKIFLMSNTNKLHFDYIKTKFDIIKEFDCVFTSYEVGKLKPHPRIYNAAIKKAYVAPGNIIFIDDRKELVRGAKKVGIRAIQFKNIKKLKQDLVKNKVRLT